MIRKPETCKYEVKVLIQCYYRPMPKMMFTRSKMGSSILNSTYRYERICGRYFVFAILQVTLGILKFKLSLITSDNTQVSI